MSTTIRYKGNTIATAENEVKTLLTAGKYMEGNVIVEDISSGGDEFIITLTADPQQEKWVPDKTYAEIAQAVSEERTIALKADSEEALTDGWWYAEDSCLIYAVYYYIAGTAYIDAYTLYSTGLVLNSREEQFEPNFEEKSVRYTPSTVVQHDTITPSAGYNGIESVTVLIERVQNAGRTYARLNGSGYITEGGQRKWQTRAEFGVGEAGWMPDGATYGDWEKFPAIPSGTSVTPTEQSQSIGAADTMMEGPITISPIPSEYIVPSGTLAISANGSYDVAQYAGANVSIAFPPSVTVEPLSVTENGTYSAPSGKAYSPVTVNVSGGGSGITADEIAARRISGVMAGSETYIGSYAFYGCKYITGAYFPNTGGVGMYAFYSCASLTDVQLRSTGGSVAVQSYAFWACKALPKLSFPTVSSIGSNAFQYCSGASFADFPIAARIDTRAFMSCYKLASISFPQASIISDYVFAACSSLAEANLPSAKSLGYSVFMSCGNLSKVTLPVVSVIGGACFSRCFKLTELHLEDVPSVPKLSASTAFFSTPIGGYTGSTGGVYGSVFVPASLYAAFCASQYWSLISSRIVSV